MAVWAKPEIEIDLPEEANAGISALSRDAQRRAISAPWRGFV